MTLILKKFNNFSWAYSFLQSQVIKFHPYRFGNFIFVHSTFSKTGCISCKHDYHVLYF